MSQKGHQAITFASLYTSAQGFWTFRMQYALISLIMLNADIGREKPILI